MQDGTTTISEADLTRLLPTCQRCRRLRRKCDTQLPACRLCQKGKAECTFFDHALQQTLPRSKGSTNGKINTTGGDVSSRVEPLALAREHNHVRTTSTISSSVEFVPSNDWGTYNSEICFDKHFVIRHAHSSTCWQFFGSSSAYSLAVELIVLAQSKFGQISHPEKYANSEYSIGSHSGDGSTAVKPRDCPSQEEVERLVNFYMRTTNLIVDFIDPDKLAVDIAVYLRCFGSNNRLLSGVEAHQYFRISMMCAIAAANKSRHIAAMDAEAAAYYAEALQCVEEVTSDISAESLHAILLLVLFGVFEPKKCDIWKLLDFACRLSVELNYHQEPNNVFEDETSRRIRRSTFWGLYCLERTIGQHFGRPSDLLEEIITTEYPVVLNENTVTDLSQTQYLQSSHYYRLCYLRSEIFRELYLPASTPVLPREWYAQQLEQITAWKRELQFLDETVGVGSLTCEVGFDTSVCFLFQPLLLRALAAAKEPVLASDSQDLIPEESYYSACNVVNFYAKLLTGAEDTAVGQYPITLISLQWIHQAALTVLAHCLLAADGRFPVIAFSNTLDGAVAGPIDFQDIYEISETCLMLLESIARRWPGMVGVRDIYKNIADKVLPAITGRNAPEPSGQDDLPAC
ncbi:hypothetical protein DV735_g648, partial [Chaetothyriales sp. CBS 134920]